MIVRRVEKSSINRDKRLTFQQLAQSGEPGQVAENRGDRTPLSLADSGTRLLP
jgi:hypothetical protein